jgi:hypothetical protein
MKKKSSSFELNRILKEWSFDENSVVFQCNIHLYKTNMLSWIFIVQAQWNNSLRVDMLPQLDRLSWFRANQSLLFLLNTASLVIYWLLSIILLQHNSSNQLYKGLSHATGILPLPYISKSTANLFFVLIYIML